MSGPRALRFEHPDFAAAGGPTGLALSAAGALDTVQGDAAVRQALLLLLTTAPGERVMRPDYGCDLRKLVFSPNDDTTAGLAIHYVRRAVEAWEPRVDVLRIDAAPAEDEPGRLDVVLDYRVRATQREDRITIPVALDGGPRR
jgi:phage baseplate assembly protein W